MNAKLNIFCAAARSPLLAVLVALATAPAGSRAQSPSPTPKPKVAYVRFWNMLPDHKKDTLQLFLAANQPLTTTGASNNSASYTPVLPNTYTFSVQRLGDEKEIKTPSTRLVDGSFWTILATPKNGQINLEMIDDTIDPTKEDGSARLMIRQYYPGVRPVVTVGANPAAIMNYGDVITLDRLPASELPVLIEVVLPNGTTKSMNTTVDLTSKHHGELILVADSYARFRPFFAADGQTDVSLKSLMEP